MKVRNTVTVNGKRYVCKIWDNEGETFDRYTVAFRGYRDRGRMVYPYIGASTRPFSPHGYGEHGWNDDPLGGANLGKRVAFDTLPEDVQKFIIQELEG